MKLYYRNTVINNGVFWINYCSPASNTGIYYKSHFMKSFFFIGILISFTPLGLAQSAIEEVKSLEDSLITSLEKIRTAETLKEKFEFNTQFENILRNVLRYDEAFTYKFNSLSKVMSTKISPDKAFRIFNWNIEVPDIQEHYFFCLVMKYDSRKGEYVIIELFDKSKYATRVEYTAHDDKKWFGALYYEIIPVKKGANTTYTLLGWDGNNRMSNKKIIETMSFQGQDKIKFGLPIFKQDEDTKRRVVFQYNKKASISVKYQLIKKKEYIIFDHLSPMSGQLAGIPDYLVPDLSFDAFVLENGKWRYLKDFDARTGKSRNDNFFIQPKEIAPPNH